MTEKSITVINSGSAPLADVETFAPALQKVVTKIDRLFAEAQATNIQTFWHIGRLISEVRDNPDKYLTEEQRSAHVAGEALLVSVFAPVYSVDQLRGSVTFFERYPSEGQLSRLLELRCPERPRWRLTASHVQLLAQIPDDDQRAAVEERCVEEAYTARALAQELQELRGKKRPGAGRTHEAPKGLKQQIADLLNHQRRFITRSEHLWLNEESDNIYDDIANAPPLKLDETVRGYLDEIEQNFLKMGEIVDSHRMMLRKIREEILSRPEPGDAPEEDAADDEPRASKSRSHMTR